MMTRRGFTWVIVAFGLSGLGAQPCAADQIIVNGVDDDLPQNAIEYNSILGAGDTAWSTEAAREQIVSEAGTFSDLRVVVDLVPGAPATGQNFAFTVRKNGLDSSPALNCTISEPAKTCADTSDSFTVAAGDRVSLKVVGSATATVANNNARWSLRFVGDTDNRTLLMGGTSGQNLATSGTEYVALQGHSWPGAEDQHELVIPTSGTLRNLYVKLSAAPGGGGYTFHVRKNAADAGLACGALTDTTCSQTTASVSVAAGDRISVRSFPQFTPAAARAMVAVTFEPSTEGEFILGSVNFNETLSTSATQYAHVNSGKLTLTTTEALAKQLGQEMTIKNIQVKLDGAPGAAASGKKYTFTLRKGQPGGAMANAGLGCSVCEADTTCAATDPAPGALSAGAGADVDIGGNTDWTTPGNITASDDARATVSLPVFSESSDFLRATSFGFCIPPDATITGIRVEIEKSQTGGSGDIRDDAIRLTLAGSSTKAINAAWPTTDTYSSYGGSSDLWGTTPTAADINASGFGVDIKALCYLAGSCGTAQVDHVRITVYYDYDPSVDIADDDELATQIVPAGTPTARKAWISYTGFLARRRLLLLDQ